MFALRHLLSNSAFSGCDLMPRTKNAAVQDMRMIHSPLVQADRGSVPGS